MVDEVTDTADTMKPAHIILSAFFPSDIVTASVENKPISHSGNARQITVPITIIIPVMARVMLYILRKFLVYFFHFPVAS